MNKNNLTQQSQCCNLENKSKILIQSQHLFNIVNNEGARKEKGPGSAPKEELTCSSMQLKFYVIVYF